jgi:uncharacterized membrane protein YfcA
MHVAVATWLAAIIPTSISSSRAHERRGIDWPLVRAWAPGMVVGGLLGSMLAASASDRGCCGRFRRGCGARHPQVFLHFNDR